MTDTNPTVTEAEALEALSILKLGRDVGSKQVALLQSFILSSTNVERERDALKTENDVLQSDLTGAYSRLAVLEDALFEISEMLPFRTYSQDATMRTYEHQVLNAEVVKTRAASALRGQSPRKALEAGA